MTQAQQEDDDDGESMESPADAELSTDMEAADGKYEIRFGFFPIGILDITLGKVEPKSTNVLPMSIG